jgi:FMN phosphatase YigB (HAD superfamily)
MPPQFIYFDLGNVLCLFDRERAFGRMSAVSGADPRLIRDVVMEGGLQAALERGALDWEGFHAEFSRRTSTACDAQALAAAASDMFRLNVGMLPVIASLERAGCRMGILSNTCDVHWRHLIDSGYALLPGPFAPIMLSHEVKSVKPEPEIYAKAAARAGVSPSEIFFCDDLQPHVDAARAAHWDAELFTSVTDLIDALDRRGLRLGL